MKIALMCEDSGYKDSYSWCVRLEDVTTQEEATRAMHLCNTLLGTVCRLKFDEIYFKTCLAGHSLDENINGIAIEKDKCSLERLQYVLCSAGYILRTLFPSPYSIKEEERNAYNKTY